MDPNNPDRIWITGSSFNYSTDGGKTWPNLQREVPGPRVFGRAFGDFRSLWVDPEDSDRMIATSDGGVFQSFDGGRTCEHYQTIRGGEVYALGVDMDTPYNIYAGLQDHESWKGPSNGWAGSIGIDDWTTVGTGDGMYNRVDPTDSRWVYNTQEFGGLGRFDQKTHERIRIQPTRTGTPNIVNLSPENSIVPLRVNWIAPFMLSPYDPKTIYSGAQVVFKSTDRGDHWQEISPDLTNNDPAKIDKGKSGSNIVYCDISTMDESPAAKGLLWIGTDDGKVWITRDDGAHWTDVTKNVAAAGGPEDVWVSRVYASRFAAGTAYVAKTGRRQDIFKPYLFKTMDFGATWKNISSNLPQWPVNSIVEDLAMPSVLFAGTDIGVYVSIDGGIRWVAFKSNMPPAPVTDMVIHPREQDLVVGTYGRGIWVSDIAPIAEMAEKNLAKGVHLFSVKPKPIRRDGAVGNYRMLGDAFPSTPNDPNGLLIYYYLAQDASQPVAITITDQTGKVVRTVTGSQRAGINRVSSEGGFGGGRGAPGAAALAAAGAAGRGGQGAAAAAGRGAQGAAAAGRGAQGAAAAPPAGGRGGQAAMPPGDYVVTLQVGETTLTQKARVLPTPNFR